MKQFSGSIWQDGMEVASVSAPDEDTLTRELTHYAMMYSQDGPVEVRRKGYMNGVATRTPQADKEEK